MNSNSSLTALVMTVLSCAAVSAQAQQKLPLWEVGAFAGVATTPAYPGSVSRITRGLVLPYLVYRGDVLRIDKSGVDAVLAKSDKFEFDVGFAASLPANSKDVAARAGMPDLGPMVEFGPRIKMTLANPTPTSRVRLEAPLRAVLEINHGIQGQGFSFTPEVVFETPNLAGGWGLSASVGLVVGDTRLNRHLYSVAPAYATASRPAYEARAGLIASRATLSTSKNITRDVQVFGFTRYESYASAANRSSPLMLKSNGTSFGVGLIWILGRSE